MNLQVFGFQYSIDSLIEVLDFVHWRACTCDDRYSACQEHTQITVYIYISEKCAKNYKNLPLAVNGSFFPSCQLQIV